MKPTAAALGLRLSNRSAVEAVVLVFGSWRWHLRRSVLRIATVVFDVKATSSDTQLVVSDWDRRIRRLSSLKILEQTHAIDLRRRSSGLQTPQRSAVEKAKTGALPVFRATPCPLPFICHRPRGTLHIRMHWTPVALSPFGPICAIA